MGLALGSVVLVGGSVAASSLVAGYPVLGGQAMRYVVAGLALAAWARFRRQQLSLPAGREWLWLVALALIGFAGCSVLMVKATEVADPAGVGVVIGTAPLVIVVVAARAARLRPTGRLIIAAALVALGSATAQLGTGRLGIGHVGIGQVGEGPLFNTSGFLLSSGALAGVVGSTLLAAPLLPRLGALAVTTYGCVIAGAVLLVAAGIVSLTDGSPILAMPTGVELASLAYLAIVVTAAVFIAWYGAMERLGTSRTGLFNGLIPITSLIAVALVGTGSITPMRVVGALAVLAGVVLGLAGRSDDSARDRQRGSRSSTVVSSSSAASA